MVQLLENLHPEKDERSEKLTQEKIVQLAFAKTYPRNICISADESKEFPYFMMIRNKELIKIHGSSIVGTLIDKPKWVCCQNLVISGVTKRSMAKFIVPISDEILQFQEKTDYTKAKKMDELKLPQKMITNEVPSAILRYLRGKNHNEYIQNKLTQNQAYLELDEDQERIVYFYVRDPKNSEKNLMDINEMRKKIWKDAEKAIFKRNFICPVSDKTKLHIDEFGDAIDILDSNEYITFLVKSAHKEVFNHILEKAKKIKIQSEDIHMIAKHYPNIILVYMKDKVLAKALLESVKAFLNKRGVACRIISNLRFPDHWDEQEHVRREIPEVEGGADLVRRPQRGKSEGEFRRPRIRQNDVRTAFKEPQAQTGAAVIREAGTQEALHRY